MGEKKKLVLIGNGMAGVNVIEHLLKLSPQHYEITIFGSEPHPNYNRILLSYVLAGNSEMKDIVINDYTWYEENHIQLLAGHTIKEIDRVNRTVTSDLGATAQYDALIMAAGSDPFILPIPGAEKEGVMAYRTIQDCEKMMQLAKQYNKAVVIGGGLLGLEAARGLLNLGMCVDVVHICNFLMERQLDETASKMLQGELERQGMNFLLEKQSAEIIGNHRVSGLKFKDGTVADADLIVMAVGIRPNVALAKECGLEVERGIVVDDYMRTSDPHIYAVGECAQHRGLVYGLVAPLYEQGAVLAKKLAGSDSDPYTGSVVYTKLKVSGVDVFSAGEFMESEGTKAIKIHDEYSGVYKKAMVRDNRIVGAVLFGDTSDGTRLMQMIRSKTDISGLSKTSILTDASLTDVSVGAEALKDDEIVCGCNGVSKQTIVQAIKEQGCSSVEEVKNCTNASRSCGGCKGLVGELLQLTLGDSFKQTAMEAMCACTDLSRDQIVAEIKEKGLMHVREVMNVLGWKQEEGCSKCRPALNYYLTMLYPHQYEDDRSSRFVNERMHANIQKDGTYSVVPRMYGGVTTPQELMKIAEVAQKYKVPKVKLTGGQRIDLLGVKKQDLTKIWAELDMPSGYAYAKAIRTVKTCVGAEFCRFGTADSMGMGIRMEKRLERLNTPAKVKMAVSACPRNCAESGIKDLGVVAIDGGWELYAGGNGGVKVRAGDLLVKVKSEEEVMAYTEAYLQYYRETGNYGERTSEWVERLGIEHIRQVLSDEQTRGELKERIDTALKATQDPWKQAFADKDVQKELFEVIEK